ncbi:hypothetical protein CAOG_009798 [Capsaspora owczarzaki ATCC 30864]|uniref:Uncharacterized protein n=1 Tax=Capsaspora owczarzaki (strain ATCC 30864) TaxID=595528 RepID=A0A0D2X3E1_CAPO3|nr:hypothetical protein CAOG_009798 [Capsaspora owczarzaki ATCC 30864]
MKQKKTKQKTEQLETPKSSLNEWDSVYLYQFSVENSAAIYMVTSLELEFGTLAAIVGRFQTNCNLPKVLSRCCIQPPLETSSNRVRCAGLSINNGKSDFSAIHGFLWQSETGFSCCRYFFKMAIESRGRMLRPV